MSINRKELISFHNPVLREADLTSPLSVGNGEFAFTVDPTGAQSLYAEYAAANVPLCTMSQWGWHSAPPGSGAAEYTLSDVAMTEYDFNGRTVQYAVEKKTGNESVYDWLRQNPHRLNLARIGFLLDGREITPANVSGIRQELHLYEGIIESSYRLDTVPCRAVTCVSPEHDAVYISVESELCAQKRQSIQVSFPYGSPDITGSDWNSTHKHTVKIESVDTSYAVVRHELDNTVYYLSIFAEKNFELTLDGHTAHLFMTGRENGLTFLFTKEKPAENNPGPDGKRHRMHPCPIPEKCRTAWKSFWETGGVIRMRDSSDKRAAELERRIILSQYLLAVHCSGSLPPQETGLYCNSWYGKFHLEMHPWHAGALPLWNHPESLKRSLSWYRTRLRQARENAARNGYKGARWPKMTADTGIDSPSPIATLLIWQQPHILYLLETVWQAEESGEFLAEYWETVYETAEFMADFAVKNKNCRYELLPPLIPVQEEYLPSSVKNPAFEVSYWKFGLEIACNWANRLKKDIPVKWRDVVQNMAPIPETAEYYLAHENCPDTFERYNRDHPSMLGCLGLIRDERIRPEKMRRTLKRVMDCWNYSSLWGWDFALMAMTAVRLGEPELAVDLLLSDTPKNTYKKNGCNFQELRTDLPAYFPGNGGLLLAVALMSAGYAGCGKTLPGFPGDGSWKVQFENIKPFFY